MIEAILITFHVLACLTLIAVILLQVGRGHGLTGSSFGQSGVQTLFGTRAADFLAKTTTVMAFIFVFTCIGLDILYARRSRSLFGPTTPAQQIDMEKIQELVKKIQAEEAGKKTEEAVQAPVDKAGEVSEEEPRPTQEAAKATT